ncbi:MAG: precorrin-3B C(17)-methyltransferase [Alistipes sp.]|jgi:precorrin-3B C17-methyltransferase|nr:precorrin-3B C(17)-methyltransferase [Alistipes sp.]
MKITIVGIGPGDAGSITPAAIEAIRRADAVVGYKYYFQFVEPWLREETLRIEGGMKRERERAAEAFRLALDGREVCVISSGDAGIYGMAPLIYEMGRERGAEAEGLEVEVIPGISAFQKAAALLGAPIGHDLCLISLSDLMTPWEVIERRIRAAATGDFVTAVYNPRSTERYWQLHRLQEIFLAERSPETPVGYVRQAGREDQSVHLTTLGEFDPTEVDMFTVVVVGNSHSYIYKDKFVTPRGYYREEEASDAGVGRQIMAESFRTIESELREPDIAPDRKWALLHAIHTTADFEMERLLWSSDGAVERLHRLCVNGGIRTIITDVTMAAAGIRRGALERLGIEVKCYLHDPRVAEMAAAENITRTQAGIRLAVKEHPEALYVFGNAPTALMELCTLMRRGVAHPAGVVAAPVGFVHVEESKQMLKPFRDTPRLIVEGRKGGSNLAATLTNAILTYNDAGDMGPGRDV